jgi:predicted O-methyltransferase YrrM
MDARIESGHDDNSDTECAVAENNWAKVDDFISGLFVHPDPVLDAALKASEKAGLPAIEVSPPAGKLLMLLARMVGARRILEIGTLGGYSTIWLARALPADGKLISLEASQKHADVARKNIDRAGLADRVEVRVGKALDGFAKIAANGEGPFDLFFLDADKPNNPAYFEWALKLSRPGSVIVADNVVRYGGVLDAASGDQNVKGVRSFLEMMAREKRVSATAIQTVGVKGHDGFALALVLN